MRTPLTHAVAYVVKRGVGYLLLPMLAFGAAACSSPERRAERAQEAMSLRMAMHGQECVRLGFASNTDPWIHCVTQQGAQAELDALSAYHTGWRHGSW